MPQTLYATRPEELPPREVLLSMSGLEFTRAMLDGRLPGPAMAQTLNFTLTEIDKGRAVFRGAPKFAFTNPMGGVHGGWYGAVLDSALGCAAMTMVPKGSWYTTLEFKVNIARALPVGSEIEAVANVQHAGRSTVVAEAVLRGLTDGKVYATGSTTCIIMQG